MNLRQYLQILHFLMKQDLSLGYHGDMAWHLGKQLPGSLYLQTQT